MSVISQGENLEKLLLSRGIGKLSLFTCYLPKWLRQGALCPVEMIRYRVKHRWWYFLQLKLMQFQENDKFELWSFSTAPFQTHSKTTVRVHCLKIRSPDQSKISNNSTLMPFPPVSPHSQPPHPPQTPDEVQTDEPVASTRVCGT